MFFTRPKENDKEITDNQEDLDTTEESLDVEVESKESEIEVEKKPKRKRGLANRHLEDDEDEDDEDIEDFEEEKDRMFQIEEKQREALRTSLIGEFLNEETYPNVTDISFNGTNLYIQDNQKGRYMKVRTEEEIAEMGEGARFTSKNIAKLMQRVAQISQKSFTTTEPILDTEIDGYRINAVHEVASPYGTTMALRISRPKLVITPKNEDILAPKEVLDFLKVLMEINENLLISGMTGSGKTEFQKYLVGAIPDLHKISLMEDTMDSHIKELYPNKDINSWRTLTQETREEKNKITFSKLIKAGLRNNPDRLMISEIRGGEEAYDLLVATLTGHSVLTTLHAHSAMNIPSRLRSMIGQVYSLDNDILGDDIVNHLPFGTHLEMVVRDDGTIIRHIREVVEYIDYRDNKVEYNIIFQRKNSFVPSDVKGEIGRYVENIEFGKLSEKTVQKFKDKRVYHRISPRFIPKPEPSNKQNNNSNNNRNNKNVNQKRK